MGYKVLLADDSITIQKVIGIIFANEDYDLTVVDNGNSAVEKAKEILPDVILVDALMPGKSGYEVCREVRLDVSLKDVPLLLLVGAFEPFDEEKARNSGADDHISKPFESQFLVEKVKKLIELGAERASARIQSGVTAPVATSDEILNLGVEAVPAMDAVSGIAAAVADGGATGGKPSGALTLDSLEIVEAAPGDDLWGVFEVEEIAEGEDVQLGEIIEDEELQPEVIDSVEEIEPFVFREDEPVSSGCETTISLGECLASDVAAENGTDEVFVLKEDHESFDFGGFPPADEPVEVPAIAQEYGVGEAGLQISGFAETSPSGAIELGTVTYPEAAFRESEEDKQFAPHEEYFRTPETSAIHQEIGTVDVSESPGTETISLSEEQLAGILSKVSREIIEKIAWEVVPDLAETIIREEIRKIKEGY